MTRREWSLCRLVLPLTVVSAPALAATAVLTGTPPRAITDPASVASPALAAARAVPVADLFYTRGGLDAAWTPDGKSIVISTNLTGRFNLWKVPAEGGFPLQLTQSDDRQLGITLSPDGATVVFQSDQGGGEIYDLYAVPMSGGAVTNLTHSADVSETSARFSRNGKSIAFEHRLQKGSVTDIAVMDVASRKVTLLTHEASPDHHWSLVDFTADGRSLIANRANFASTEGAVWRIDIASAKAEALTPAGRFSVNTASAVSPDGNTIAVTTEKGGEKQAALLNASTRAITLVKPDPWEQSSGSLSPDGRTLIFSSNVDGRTELFSSSGGRIARLDLPPGVNSEAANDASSFARDGRHLLVSHQASNTPFDYWIVDIAAHHAGPVTRFGLASIDPGLIPAAQIVHYKSGDGTVISALLWVPFNLKRDGHAPAVVLPHGGPTGQTVDSFNRTAIALASRGYVVIAPNPRGSTGYGRAFMEANRKDLGGGDLTDEVYGAKFMVVTGYVDAQKVGITGGSYGGYMTLMAIARTPKLWAAAVEEYGIINWFSMYQTEAPTLQQYQMGLIGDPVKDKSVYDAASPLTYMKMATAPLLVLQGENDIRVPQGQAKQVVELLKGLGRTVDAHYYPNEGHGFVKRENQIDAMERTVAWFGRYLKGAR
ncbi:MAG: S9 family peptidase [Steroidobacteraceae bacterium]